MGIPYREYSCMTIGELSDLYDFWMDSEGLVILQEIEEDTSYIPEVR